MKALNRELLNDSSAIYNEEYDSGWLIKIKPFDINKDEKGLICGDKISELFIAHSKCLADALLSEIMSKKSRNAEYILSPGEVFERFRYVFNKLKLDLN